MTSAPTRPQPFPEQAQRPAKTHPPKTRGHLVLLEWSDTPPAAPKPPAASKPPASQWPARRTLWSRCHEAGPVLLIAATLAALVASMCRF